MIKLLLFKNKKYPNHYFLLFSFFIISLITILHFVKKESYNIYQTYGTINCDSSCYLDISLNYQKINIINNSKIKIDDKYYEYKNIEYKDQYLNNNIPEQEVVFELNEIIPEKIVEVKIEYNKQRILTKIKQIILERE